MRSLNSKAYKNDICQACIKKNIKKYGKMSVECCGITVEDDVKFAIKNGMTEEEAQWAYNPCYFFEKVYGSKPRNYQRHLLCCTSRKLVARFSRQTGKTLCSIMRILHYVVTNEKVTVLICTPQEAQIKKIFDEYILRDAIYRSQELKASMVSKTMSPFYQVVFDNGSKIILMIAGPGTRGQSANWLYIDEAAIVGKDILSDVLMTMASKGDEASILMTSTPKSKNDQFYKACEESPEFSEIHVSIYDVEEMRGQVEFYRKLLSADGFIQEAEAGWLSSAGGPFNIDGIRLAKSKYEYEDCTREDGYLYFIGVDWNGPNVGTYFYVIGFNPDTGRIKAVDKKVISSAIWNSTVAKSTLIELNRKWKPKCIMADYGYGLSIIEDLKLWSLKSEQNGDVPPGSPDAMIKHILEPVQFGGWVDIDDPFTRETIKKTTRAFMVAEVSKLFEPQHDNTYVPISFPASDQDLINSLENYKIINITSKGTEQYGFEKNSGIEDHLQDTLNLAVYGIVKHYSELFKRIIAESVPIYRDEVFVPPIENSITNIHHSQSIVLLTDNSPEIIALDERKLNKFEPKEDSLPIISRSFNRGIERKVHTNNFRRQNSVISRALPF